MEGGISAEEVWMKRYVVWERQWIEVYQVWMPVMETDDLNEAMLEWEKRDYNSVWPGVVTEVLKEAG